MLHRGRKCTLPPEPGLLAAGDQGAGSNPSRQAGPGAHRQSRATVPLPSTVRPRTPRHREAVLSGGSDRSPPPSAVLLLQVEGKSSIVLTFRQLMAEEGPWGLMKGLSARIISATPSTIVIVVGYESLKKLSLRPELVDSRHW